MHSTLRQELGALREQVEEMRRLKDAFERSGIVEKEKAVRLSSALSQVEADNRDLIARYQQLELRLTHAEAELDTLRRSEKDRSLQLQVPPAPVASASLLLPHATCSSLVFALQGALADVQHLGDTVQEQLAAIRQLEAANKKLAAEASTAQARAEKAREDEGMVDLLRQALAGLQEDRRSMQVMLRVTCDV